MKRVWSIPVLAPALLLLSILPARAAGPLEVIVAEARSEALADRLELLGTLQANEAVELSVAVTDTITAIHFEDGQQVTAGEILAEMTSSEEHALLEEEQSTLAEAQKQYDRMAVLVRQGSAAQSMLDQRERELATARARLRAIESRLQDRLILAPFSGVVGLRNISVGALVAPGDVITTLDDLSSMKLDFTVPAVHLAALRPGIAVEAQSPAYGERLFSGEVQSIGSRIDPVTRSVVARALLPNPDRLLRPGMLMQVTLLKNPRQAVTIPEEALIPSGMTNAVFVVEPGSDAGTAQKKEVRLGLRHAGRVEVTAGLGPGELLITHGNLKVRPGQAVVVLAIDDGTRPLEELLGDQQRTPAP